jgi:hypothetical protein
LANDLKHRMKLDYLKNLSAELEFSDLPVDQLVRLYDFNGEEARRFRTLVQEQLLDGGGSVDVSKLDFVESVNCSLVLNLSEEDLGMLTEDEKTFHCDMTRAAYTQLVYLLGAFCGEKCKGFQWLYEMDNPIEFLFSQSGAW